MGKFAKALKIGVKGDITITLQQRQFVPGQIVNGQVNLKVLEPFYGEAFKLTVVGRERLNWQTTTTRHEHGKTVHETTNHRQKLILFSSTLVLAPGQQYEPGGYVHPFNFTLPLDLPPSVDFSRSSVGNMGNLRARIEYKLKVSLPVHGTFRADLDAKGRMCVVSDAVVEPRSARATRCQEVELLGLFSRGKCEFEARLRSDVLRVGESADIRCKVVNQSKKRVKEVSSLLYQDITVTPLEGGGGTCEYTATVNETSFPGFEPSKVADVRITPKMNAQGGEEMLPTFQGTLFSIKYRMRVKCAFSLCPSTKVEFPLTIVA